MMTIQEQADLLIKTFPRLVSCRLRALSSSGIFWVNERTGTVYKVQNNKAEKVGA